MAPCLFLMAILPLTFQAEQNAERSRDNDAIKKLLPQHLSAWEAKDWRKVVLDTDPEALRFFKDQWSVVLKKHRDLPTIRAFVPKDKDLETVLAMSVDEFYQTFLSSIEHSRFLMQDYRFAKSEVIGIVHEKVDFAHAVVRFERKDSGVTTFKMEVVTLKKARDGWKLLLPGELRNFAEQLRAR